MKRRRTGEKNGKEEENRIEDEKREEINAQMRVRWNAPDHTQFRAYEK